VNREQAVSGALAFLAVLALGGVAATLDATGASGTGTGSGDEGGVGSGPTFSLGGGYEPIDATVPSLPEWLGPLLAGLLLVVTVYGTYELYREHGLRRIAGAVAVSLVAAAGLYLLLRLLRPGESGVGPGVREGEPSLPGGGSGGAATDAATRAVDPPTALLVALGLVLLGAVAVIVRATGDQRTTLATSTPSETPETAERAAVAAAIETGDDLDNAVYRAWREMVADLPVSNPEASTPADFADAAVEAGMDAEDVAEVTGLFEAVRYGDRPVTEARAERATDALRRLERTDAEGDPKP
jgi:hypothetical protein